MAKIGRNAPCPCGRVNKKFKHCCLGKIDWENLRGADYYANLSVRGRNIRFYEEAFSALKLDALEVVNRADYKRAFTAAAVRDIHEAIIRIWAPTTDLSVVLPQDSSPLTGLYVGEYELPYLTQGVSRHSLYADKIQLIDPFVYAVGVRDEYSPLANPDQYRSITLRFLDIWVTFLPWVAEGLVEFIRIPSDFDRNLYHRILEAQRDKLDSSPELQALVNEYVNQKKQSPEFELQKQHDLVLFPPDDYLLRQLDEMPGNLDDAQKQNFLRYVRQLREEHPYYVEPDKGSKEGYGQIQIMTTGSSYLEARLTAGLSGAYLVTDLASKWKEIEMDRAYAKVDPELWAPLAKAFQGVPFNYLNNVDLEAALRLRTEDRLEPLRGFLRRLWASASRENLYSQENAVQLASELQHYVNESEAEWSRIDQDLLKWFGGEAAFGAVTAIASGQAAWYAGAVAAAGLVNIGVAQWQRKEFWKLHPGAVFMDLRKRVSTKKAESL